MLQGVKHNQRFLFSHTPACKSGAEPSTTTQTGTGLRLTAADAVGSSSIIALTERSERGKVKTQP